MTATPRRTIRLSDEEWEAAAAEAALRGHSITSVLLSGWLRPSFGQAVAVLDLAVLNEHDRTDLLLIAPDLPDVTAARLRAMAAGLTALAVRWPQ